MKRGFSTSCPAITGLSPLRGVSARELEGNIAVTGNLMVIAEYPNQIAVFRINSDGSLTLLTTTTIDEQGEGLFSLSVFPNTR
jgi:hypothetical protein